ncbi:hypothetical protein VZT92_023929 [Zoarces viviparus]|uniref:Uncharacterized protein n=1 Tax=Zoarces viviparus TaxID=48416 RepID=A0AAW1E8E2_ZOAVI
MEEEARSFLGSFVEEFPAALEDGSPLPVSPLSRRVTLEELHGESLELGLRLLAARVNLQWRNISVRRCFRIPGKPFRRLQTLIQIDRCPERRQQETLNYIRKQHSSYI